MRAGFKGWQEVDKRLHELADGSEIELNDGQRASLVAIASRLKDNGVIIADEVGMGKTRIAAAVAKCVIDAGGRVAILVPPGLGYQWGDELRAASIHTPPILRSLWQFLQAWGSEEPPKPWFKEQALLISHAFTNWRLGENAAPWRWALLPEIYARWRKEKKPKGRWPRDYCSNKMLDDVWVRQAAESIVSAICASPENHPTRKLIEELAEMTPWPGALTAGEYGRDAQLRPWLERAVGLGLGVFNLVITDEAHKSRGQDSGLNRLLEQIVLHSDSARRVAMTATPVELDAQQWIQILGRIQKKDLASASDAISTYAEAVRKVRQCPSDEMAREAYKNASTNFKTALDPYLLRRDKREDPSVLNFQTYSGERFHAYRREKEILIETKDLSGAWKQAVCAAEALSFVTQQADDPIGKRLRLTLGNGHGVAALIDQIHCHEVDDKKQNEDDGILPSTGTGDGAEPALPDKRTQRAVWWREVMIQASQGNTSGDAALYDHPAILAAVAAIEEICQRGEKVLVFGRFTRPLRDLVELLNARAMLRSVDTGQLWPQSKVHENEWNAVVAAHRQLQRAGSMNRDDLDMVLDAQYKQLETQRVEARKSLLKHIETGLVQVHASDRVKALFDAFKKEAVAHESGSVKHPLVVVTRAIQELVDPGGEASRANAFAHAFVDLVEAASDRDEGDADGDGALNPGEAGTLWTTLNARLHDEYSRTEGGFARLMYGDTKPVTRRLLPLAFNRQHSHPKVLVAQSLVGREGLNLHKACRCVILLHPEWNPGVVEQQIGRVDRIGSLWEKKLKEAIGQQVHVSEFPRIEICPVVFQGTYDERNWQVLRERWNDLRAQLHGIVITPCIAEKYSDAEEMIAEINDAAPNFSPSKRLPQPL